MLSKNIMKYKTLELIREGDKPLIRITYESVNFWGRKKYIVRDVVKCGTVKNYWVFADDCSLTHKFETINSFYESGEKFQKING